MRLASYIAAPNTSYILSIQKYLTEARALIEKEWPREDTYAYDTYAFSQIPVREWPTQEVRMEGHLGTFFKRGKNRAACPVCSALVHVDDIHRHAGWHGMNQIALA